MEEKYRDLFVRNLKRKSYAILTLISLYYVRKLLVTTRKQIKCNAMQRNKFKKQYNPYISSSDYPINNECYNT